MHSDGYSCSVARPQMLSCGHFYCKRPRGLSDPFYHYCSWLCACLILAKLLLEVILVHTDGYSCSIARPQMLSCDHFYCKRPRALSDPFYHYCSWLCACLILAKLLLEVILVHTVVLLQGLRCCPVTTFIARGLELCVTSFTITV